MSKQELKPCPNILCNSKNASIVEECKFTIEHSFHIKCYDCGCSGKIYKTKREAIKAWDTRPESAWKMFRRLCKKYGYMFIDKLRYKCFLKGEDVLFTTLKVYWEFIIRHTSRKAIKIMQEIEKELEDG